MNHHPQGPYLDLLAHPADQDLLGNGYLYDLTPAAAAWAAVTSEYRGVTGSDGNLPYTALLTVLRVLGKTSAEMDRPAHETPPTGLVTAAPLHRDDLHDAVGLWEQAALQVPKDKISLKYDSLLADQIAAIPPQHIRLADHLSAGTQTFTAPGWLYPAATWNPARLLTDHPLCIDGRKIALRADDTGDVHVWQREHLWTATWAQINEAREARKNKKRTNESAPPREKESTKYAGLRLEVLLGSLPGTPQPYILIQPRVLRYSNRLDSARTVYYAAHPEAPLMTLTLGGYGEHTRFSHTSRIALESYARLRATSPLLPDAVRDLSAGPGDFRAVLPFSTRFPIGLGPGMRAMAAVGELTRTAFNSEPLRLHQCTERLSRTRRSTHLGRDTHLLDAPDLDQIFRAAACDRLRILALYHNPTTRTRLQKLLCYHFNRPDLANAADAKRDDTLIPLNDHTEISFSHVPQLLEHRSNHTGRLAAAQAIPHRSAPPGTRILALAETEFDASDWSRRRRASRKPDSTEKDPYLADAKPYASRYLARLGILAQFLTFRDRPFQPSRSKAAKIENPTELERLGQELSGDHPGHYAIADLMRGASLVPSRLTRNLAYTDDGLKEPLIHVGLHLRQQRGNWKAGEPPRLVWLMSALVPDGQYWRALAYRPGATHTPGTWIPYTEANLEFRSGPLPPGRRQDQHLTHSIDQALLSLGHHKGAATGYVLYVNGNSCRSLWPHLANTHLDQPIEPDGTITNLEGRLALPGLSLAKHQRPRAIVRVTDDSTFSGKLPRPALLQHARTDPETGLEVLEPGKRTNGLFAHPTAPATWYLAHVPQQFNGGTRYARAGEHYSRWASDDPEEQAENWYAHTLTELHIPYTAAGDAPYRYALSAARLCDSALSYDHRTDYPLPVHLAIQMDKDHPNYRRMLQDEEDAG
ncbi:RNaseH domain-containing protein (plasmid) [Streptomyces sp. NBC_01525]|uniref:RNaseH domain-containing protein n=1 Tax=Streptomyces sp. NBC_01525 TaxID=2903893 RepID=UPI002F912BE1